MDFATKASKYKTKNFHFSLHKLRNMVASSYKLSQCFKDNLLFLKFFAIWPGQNPHRYYKYYMILFISINIFIYNFLLVLNFIHTPREIELMSREALFLFTEVTVMGKVFMVLRYRKKLFAAFDILDCEAFKSNDEASKQMLQRNVSKYRNCWKICTILGHFSYSSQVVLPIFTHLIFKTNMDLPICKYYFLDYEVVHRYFAIWFIYQSFGMYSHLQYNIQIDTLISGLLYLAIKQVGLLKRDLKNLRILKIHKKNSSEDDILQMIALNKYLKHYELILKYCEIIQDIIGITLFIQFGMGSVIICVVLCGFLLNLPIESIMFLVGYLCAVTLQIFVPSLLGTQLSFESQELVSAAYCSEWIPRSEEFKRSLKLFMTRANTNIVITGWRIFPLSLDTFTSIMKTAYSFFTLVRECSESGIK